MLRWISRNRRKYRIQDEKIHLKIRMNPIDERWKESCLRWFGLVQRRERLLHQWGKVSWVKLNEWMKICRGRPKIALVEVVENDMSITLILWICCFLTTKPYMFLNFIFFTHLALILWFTSFSISQSLWIIDPRYQKLSLFGIS